MKIFLKISALFVLIVAIQYFWGWHEIFAAMKDFAESGSSPWAFLAVMGIGCAVGFPLSICYLYAGLAFRLWEAWTLCIIGLGVSSSLGFILGKIFSGAWLVYKMSERFGAGDRGKRNMFRLNFFVRAIPGIPYWTQNIFLGAVCRDFKMYALVNISVQGAIAMAMNMIGSAIVSDGSAKYGVIFCLVMVLMLMHWLFSQFYSNQRYRLYAKAFVLYSLYAAMNMIFILLSGLVSLALLPFAKLRRRAISGLLSSFLKWYSVKTMPAFGAYRLEVCGLENISRGSSVFVSNHTSWMDPLILLSFIPDAGVVVKKRYASWLAIWVLVRFFNFVSVDDDTPSGAFRVLTKAERIMRGGGNLLVFPEGRRSPNGRLLDFKKLAFKLSKNCSARLVPVAIWSEKPFLTKGGSLLPEAGGKFSVRFLAPLNPSDFRSADELSASAYNAISKALSEMRRL